MLVRIGRAVQAGAHGDFEGLVEDAGYVGVVAVFDRDRERADFARQIFRAVDREALVGFERIDEAFDDQKNVNTLKSLVT